MKMPEFTAKDSKGMEDAREVNAAVYGTSSTR